MLYLADRMGGRVGLDLQWPLTETVQFMYSRHSETHALSSSAAQIISFTLLLRIPSVV